MKERTAQLIQLPLPSHPSALPATPRPEPGPPRPERQLPRTRSALGAWPESEKPRERLQKQGPQSLSDAELIAILLRTGEGAGKGSALDQARNLLIKFGGPEGLAAAGAAELQREPGVGPAKACSLVAAFCLAERARGAAASAREPIGSSRQVFEIMAPRLSRKRAEEFWVLLLNTRNHLLREVQVALGSLSGASVHPREVFSAAVREGAAALIFVHNHPSGDPTPSRSDRALTDRLLESAQLLGLRVLDHVVIGHERWESFADRGWL